MSKPEQKLVRFDWAMKNILRNKANFDILEGLQYEYDYLQRILFGTSKAIVERVMVGGKHREIPKVISVNILYQSVVPEKNKGYIYRGKTDITDMFNPEEHFPEQGEGVLPEYFFQEAKIEDEFEAPGLKEAEEKLNYLAMSKAEQNEYDRYMDALHYEVNSLDTAVSEAKAEGALEAKLATARNLLDMGMSVENVAKATDLPPAEVKEIASK